MTRLNFEEKGLLRILQRIREGGADLGPAVRFALVDRGLLEGGEPPTLSPAGIRLLDELRARQARITGEICVADLKRAG